MKNILYIGGFELPDKNAAAHRVIANAKILKKLDYSVYFIGTSKTINPNIPIQATKEVYEDFTFYLTPYPKNFKDWVRHLSNITYYSLIKEINPSIIIAYNFPAISLFNLFRFTKENSIRLIGDCTEWYGLNGNILFRALKGCDTWLRMRILHKKLDGLIVISKFLSDFYKDKSQNIVYIPPLVDPESSKWERIRTQQNENRSNDILLVYAGSPGTGYKDRLDKIISAVYRIEKEKKIGLKFTIIGISKAEYIKSFNPKSTLEIDNEFINFLGRIPHEEALDIINESDFEIIIRDNNRVNTAGFPTKFVESITCGTPVITNLFSNIKMYLEVGKNCRIVDTSSELMFFSTMAESISCSKGDILKMKEYCLKNNKFDFRLYINDMQSFMRKVERPNKR